MSFLLSPPLSAMQNAAVASRPFEIINAGSLLIAERSKLKVVSYRSSAEGELEFEQSAGYRFKRIVIRPQLGVEAGAEAQAQRVVEKAHKACLVARSLSCPVDIEPTISS